MSWHQNRRKLKSPLIGATGTMYLLQCKLFVKYCFVLSAKLSKVLGIDFKKVIIKEQVYGKVFWSKFEIDRFQVSLPHRW